jgi:uroporphyrinogen-III synthase
MSTLLITRPEPDASHSAAHLLAMSLTPIKMPLLERVKVEADLPGPEGFAAIAITSANAVRALAEAGEVNRFTHLPVYAVGLQTSSEAQLHGFKNIAHVDRNLAGLADHLAHTQVGGPIFYPCGIHLSGDLGRTLAPFGVNVVTCPIYDMVRVGSVPEVVLEEIENGGVDGCLVYSRRTAAAFVALVGSKISPEAHKKIAMLCFSEKVAEPLIEGRFVRILLSERPDEEAMMSLALSFAREQNAS